MAARAIVILRGEGCWALFVLHFYFGEDILFEVISLVPRSGVLAVSEAAELGSWDQVLLELPQHLGPGTEIHLSLIHISEPTRPY